VSRWEIIELGTSSKRRFFFGFFSRELTADSETKEKKVEDGHAGSGKGREREKDLEHTEQIEDLMRYLPLALACFMFHKQTNLLGVKLVASSPSL